MCKVKSKLLFQLSEVLILGMFLAGCITPTPAMVAPNVTATALTKPTVAATVVSTVTPIVPAFATSIATALVTTTPALPEPMLTKDNIPAPFRCYLNGVAAKDLDATTACFADDALVIDVGRRIEGKDAIRRWLSNEVMGLKYEAESVTPKQDGAVVIVKISFGSGGGFRASYDMDFRNEHIIKMDLQYA